MSSNIESDECIQHVFKWSPPTSLFFVIDIPVHLRLEPFMFCSQISDRWSMNFTAGRPKIASAARLATKLPKCVSFHSLCSPSPDKNHPCFLVGVSSPPGWISSNKNGPHPHLGNAQVQSLLFPDNKECLVEKIATV